VGQTDQAIARGFGFKSREAMQAKLEESAPLQVVLDDQGFRARLREFNASAPEGLFLNCVGEMVSNAFGDVFIGFQDDQVKALARVRVRLNRMPTPKELERDGLEYETFLPVFQRNATLKDPMVAVATYIDGAIDFEGWRVTVGPDKEWLTVIGPAD
jgi:hypothetical protein